MLFEFYCVEVSRVDNPLSQQYFGRSRSLRDVIRPPARYNPSNNLLVEFEKQQELRSLPKTSARETL